MICKTSSNKIYKLVIRSDKGGEGKIYDIEGHPDRVAKIFHYEFRNNEKHQKLKYMLSIPIGDINANQLAWPIELLYDDSNKFIGYTMKKVKNATVLNLFYSANNNYDLKQRVCIAKNLCAAVKSVHDLGIVIGDLNPKNILVDERTLRVTLVDTDSYYIVDSNKNYIFKCTAGRPELYPYELLNKLSPKGTNLTNAKGETFTRETDLFALAIHVFALVNNGCHPYACGVDLSIVKSSITSIATDHVDNIKNDDCPFYKEKKGRIIPQYARPITDYPKEMQKIFQKAFLIGNRESKLRPSEVEISKALDSLKGWFEESDLKKDKKINHPTKRTISNAKITQQSTSSKILFFAITLVISATIGHFGGQYLQAYALSLEINIEIIKTMLPYLYYFILSGSLIGTFIYDIRHCNNISIKNYGLSCLSGIVSGILLPIGIASILLIISLICSIIESIISFFSFVIENWVLCLLGIGFIVWILSES